MNKIHTPRNIRYLRKKTKTTLQELGEYLGISHAQVAKYETEKSELPINRAAKIASYFRIPIDDLVYVDMEKNGYEVGRKTAPDILDSKLEAFRAEMKEMIQNAVKEELNKQRK